MNIDMARVIADEVSLNTTEEERAELTAWFEELLRIKDSDVSMVDKAKSAIIATTKSNTIIRLAKLMAKIVKRHGWDTRGTKGKGFVVAALGSVFLLGPQGAGLAALGGAIGFPLWVVFGAGGMMAVSIMESWQKLPRKNPDITFVDNKIVD